MTRVPTISRRVEFALAGAALALVGAVAFWPMFSGGGFMADDWIFRALHVASGESFFDSIDRFGDEEHLSRRPIEVIFLAALQTVFGSHAGAQLAFVVALGVFMAWALYLVLRELDLDWGPSLLIAVTVLLFPAADATKLWISAGYYSLAIAFYLLGLFLALRAFKREGTHALVLHSLSLTLYLLSIATNEFTTAAVLATGLIYLARAKRQPALRRWGADLIAVVAISLAFAGASETTAISDWPSKTSLLFREGLGVFGSRAIPLGLSDPIVIALIVFVGGLAVWRFWSSPPDSGIRRELKRWLVLAAGAIAFCAVGYAAFVPAEEGYRPGDPGLVNRVNALAGLGMIVLAFALIMLLALVVAKRDDRLKAAGWVAIGLGAAIALSDFVVLRDHERNYTDSASEQKEILATIDEKVSRPPEHSHLFYFDRHLDADPGVPVFSYTWDLTGALRLMWDRRDLEGFPHYPQLSYVCGPVSLTAAGPPFGTVGPPVRDFPYATSGIIFFERSSGRVLPVNDLASCAVATQAMSQYSLTPPVVSPHPLRAS